MTEEDGTAATVSRRWLYAAIGLLWTGCILGTVGAHLAVAWERQRFSTRTQEEIPRTVRPIIERAREHYHRHGEFPGQGKTLRTHVEMPRDGRAVPVDFPDSEDEAVLARTLEWPTDGTLHFQYVYEARGTGDDARATLVARADYKPGGAYQSITYRLRIEDGEVEIDKSPLHNQFE